jgi:hypothetical protein
MHSNRGNLSGGNDVFKIGTESSVTYFPSAEEQDRKSARRLLRNFLELFFIQEFLTNEFTVMAVGNIFNELESGHAENT